MPPAASRTRESSPGQPSIAAAADPDHVLAALERPPVEPAVERRDLEAGLVDQPPPLDRREPVQLHRGRGVARADGQPAASASPRPSRPARRSPAPARARGRAWPRCPRSSERRRRRRAGPRARAASWAARSARSFSSSSAMWRRERNGQMTSGTRSSTGGSRRSPTRRSTSEQTPFSSASARATASIPSERSTPITGTPGLRDRHGDPARADGELDDRAAAAARLVDVERDVLDDRGAPRVVDPLRSSRTTPPRAV